MEMSLRLNYLQRAHPVWALHVEPEAQVTQADTGRKWTPGCHLSDVTLPLGGRVYVEELPITTFEEIFKKEYNKKKKNHVCTWFMYG